MKHYGVDEGMRAGVYVPLRQRPLRTMLVAIRVEGGEPTRVLEAVRTLTAQVDSELPLFDVHTMSERVAEHLWARRAGSWLIAIFSTVALLLAVAGIYGVISYSVGQRTREISVRMAMGALSRQVAGQVVRQGMALVGLGVALGLVVSMAGGRLVAGILVGVSATNPWVYGGVTLLLLVVAGLANYLPARRAAGLDPMTALRGD